MEYPTFVTNVLSTFNLLKDIDLTIESLSLVGMMKDGTFVSAYPYRCFVNAVESRMSDVEDLVHLSQFNPRSVLMQDFLEVLSAYQKKVAEYCDFYYTHTSAYFDKSEEVAVSNLWYTKYEPSSRREIMEIISKMESMIIDMYPEGEFPEDGYTRIFYKIIQLED